MMVNEIKVCIKHPRLDSHRFLYKLFGWLLDLMIVAFVQTGTFRSDIYCTLRLCVHTLSSKFSGQD